MKRKMTISVILLILIVVLMLIFGNIWNPFASKQQQGDCLPQPGNFTFLFNELQTTNTPQNISFIGYYMQSYGVNTIQVHVIGYNNDFYMVRDSGITFLPPSHIDKTINLTTCHIRQIEGYIANNKLSLLDQLQLSIMYKQDGN